MVYEKLIEQNEVIELGGHRLICGDSTDSKIIEKIVGSNNIDCLLTDPPYGVSYTESKKDFSELSNKTAITNDNLDEEGVYRQFTKDWLEALLPHLAAKNSMYIFNSDKNVFALKQAMDATDVYLSQLLVWAKTSSVIGRLDYLPQHELITYGWHGTHEFEKSQDKSLLVHPKPNKSELHPTMKPPGLLRRLILNSTQIGDVVLDPFGGSGSTLIACQQTKRRCLMVESDPDHCQTIIKRFEKLSADNSNN